jgi:hypothetical protein
MKQQNTNEHPDIDLEIRPATSARINHHLPRGGSQALANFSFNTLSRGSG